MECQNSYDLQRGQIPAWIITQKDRPIYDMQLGRQIKILYPARNYFKSVSIPKYNSGSLEEIFLKPIT